MDGGGLTDRITRRTATYGLANTRIEPGEMWPLAARRLGYDSQIKMAPPKSQTFPAALFPLKQLLNAQSARAAREA